MNKGLGKRIDHLVGKAICDWNMIRDNERILLGLSGGKDSLALLSLLSAFKKKAPIEFEIIPVHIDAGFDNSFSEALERFTAGIFGELKVEHTDYGVQAHSVKNRENPCFLCSRLRRKRLFEIAKETGCRKIALGHNKDDIIETLFINIFYSGRIAAMKPSQSFFDGALDIIRPLSYVEKKEISLYCDIHGLKAFKNNCPSAGKTRRIEVREMLEQIYKKNEHIKGNIFRAMSNVIPEYLLDKKNDRYPKST